MAHSSKKAGVADKLIAKASAGIADLSLPPQAKAELAKLVAHNDSVPKGQRVSALAAIDMLRTFRVVMGRGKFDRIIQHHFGRAWGAK